MENRFKKVELLISDFDGVFTDGTVYVDQNGVETVKCSRKDGLGIKMLQKSGIEVIVVSKEVNSVVTERCKKLGIECFQSIENSDKKLGMISHLSKAKGIPMEKIAYVGDDLNDMRVFGKVGLSITVSDGHKIVRDRADFITDAKGGEHAIREIAELILEARGVALEF